MPGHAVQNVTHAELGRPRSFDRQMLFAVNDGFRIRQIEQLHARIGIVGRHRLVPKVQAQSRFAAGRLMTRVTSNAAGRNSRSGNRVAYAWSQNTHVPGLHSKSMRAGMNRKRRRAAADDPRHGRSGGQQIGDERHRPRANALAASPFRAVNPLARMCPS